MSSERVNVIAAARALRSWMLLQRQLEELRQGLEREPLRWVPAARELVDELLEATQGTLHREIGGAVDLAWLAICPTCGGLHIAVLVHLDDSEISKEAWNCRDCGSSGGDPELVEQLLELSRLRLLRG
jgi:hypothetical protein